jgi:hypothetical protein
VGLEGVDAAALFLDHSGRWHGFERERHDVGVRCLMLHEAPDHIGRAPDVALAVRETKHVYAAPISLTEQACDGPAPGHVLPRREPQVPDIAIIPAGHTPPDSPTDPVCTNRSGLDAPAAPDAAGTAPTVRTTPIAATWRASTGWLA